MTRVQTLIRDTFLTLMSQKGFDRVNVKDVLLKAGVARSSFYSHYDSKYHLRKCIEDEVLSQLSEAFLKVRLSSAGVPLTNSIANASDYYALYYECLERNEELVRLLLSEKNSNHFLFRLIDFVQSEQKLTREVWGARNVIPAQLLDYYTTSLSWAYVGAFSAWISSDKATRPSPKDMGAATSQYFG